MRTEIGHPVPRCVFLSTAARSLATPIVCSPCFVLRASSSQVMRSLQCDNKQESRQRGFPKASATHPWRYAISQYTAERWALSAAVAVPFITAVTTATQVPKGKKKHGSVCTGVSDSQDAFRSPNPAIFLVHRHHTSHALIAATHVMIGQMPISAWRTACDPRHYLLITS